MKKNDKSLSLSYPELFLIFILIVVSQLYNGSTIMLLYSLFILLCIFIMSSKKIFLVLMILIPSAENLTFYGSTTLPIVIASIYFIKYVLKGLNNRSIKIKKWYILSLILIFYGFVNYFITNSFEQLIVTIKSIFFLILISDVLEKFRTEKISYNEIYTTSIKYLGIGLIMAAIVTMLGGNGTGLERFSFGESTTVNVIGIQSAIAVIGIMFSFITKATREKMDVVIMIICGIIVLLTMSRTAILMCIIAIVLFGLFSVVKRKLFQVAILYLLITAVCICSYTFSSTIKEYVQKSKERFLVEDISNGRYQLWNQTIENMLKSKKYSYFGMGSYTKVGVMNRKNIVIIPAHNFILETWVIYGFVGTFLVFLQFYFLIKDTIFCCKQGNLFKPSNWISFIPILIIFAGFFYSHHFIGRVNSILFIIGFIPLIMNSSKKKGESYEKS